MVLLASLLYYTARPCHQNANYVVIFFRTYFRVGAIQSYGRSRIKVTGAKRIIQLV